MSEAVKNSDRVRENDSENWIEKERVKETESVSIVSIRNKSCE